MDLDAEMGPIVSASAHQRITGYIDKGVAEGAELVVDGRDFDATSTGEGCGEGFWMGGTLFDHVTPEMTIYREEIFGPVLSLLAYDDEDEAVRRANDSDYGLAAGVVTRDLARAHRIIHQMEAGICWINTWGESAAQMPVGGYKQSGIGRENGISSLAHYTRLKSVQVELGEFVSVF